MLRATGAKLGATISDGAVMPGVLVIGCDLRECTFDGKDLSGTRFVGCFLSGATFRGARLDGAQLIGCFAPEAWAPVDLRDTVLVGATVRGCHVYHLGDVASLASRWPADAATAAMALTSELAPDRNQAIQSLAAQRFVTAAPLIAYLLEDGEWDVRLSALDALASLRGAAFPEQDDALLEWMFYALGDEHSTVAARMMELIAQLRPDDAILRAAVDQVASSEPQDQLAGLRAGRTLIYGDAAYRRLIDLPAIEALARAGAPEVRRECMRFGGYLGGPDGLRLILSGLTDEDAEVRAAALSAVALLDERPHALQLARVLADPDEEVRAQAVYALNQCPDAT